MLKVANYFRKRKKALEPVVNWVYCSDVDASCEKHKDIGANIVEDIEDKP